jgi:hypothetical protein
MNKPILCLDFDGVIHGYSKGWLDGSIYDDVTDGFFEWAERAAKYFRLVIYSSRCSEPGGEEKILFWLYDQRKKWRARGGMTESSDPLSFEVSDKKPAAFLQIDDRCVCFDGLWEGLNPEEMLKFQPWNKKSI